MQGDTIQDAATNLFGAFSEAQAKLSEAIRKMAVNTGLLERKKISKHQASKKGYKHIKPIFDNSVWDDARHRFPKSPYLIPTNHERVVIGRAHKLGISVKEYQNHFSQEMK